MQRRPCACRQAGDRHARCARADCGRWRLGPLGRAGRRARALADAALAVTAAHCVDHPLRRVRRVCVPPGRPRVRECQADKLAGDCGARRSGAAGQWVRLRCLGVRCERRCRAVAQHAAAGSDAEQAGRAGEARTVEGNGHLLPASPGPQVPAGCLIRRQLLRLHAAGPQPGGRVGGSARRAASRQCGRALGKAGGKAAAGRAREEAWVGRCGGGP